MITEMIRTLLDNIKVRWLARRYREELRAAHMKLFLPPKETP